MKERLVMRANAGVDVPGKKHMFYVSLLFSSTLSSFAFIQLPFFLACVL